LPVASLYNILVPPGRGDAMLGFLLEGGQHVNPPADLHRIHCSVSIVIEPQGDLEDPTANTLNGLAVGALSPFCAS
jgi:hypothetical protein